MAIDVVSYDDFLVVFLDKIKEYEFLQMTEISRNDIIDGYMKRALTKFRKNLRYDFYTTADDTLRQFDFSSQTDSFKEQLEADLDEIVSIVTDGMILEWLKLYKNNQEILENVLNTRDFTMYSPSELLKQVRTTYNDVNKEYTQLIREYSYNHMKLEELHI